MEAEFNATDYFIDRHLREGRGDQPALLYGDQQLTYADVARLVNKTGNALRRLDVRMEERVLLLLLDGPEFIAAFWGAIKIGAVPIPTNTLLRPADYAYLLNDSRARVAIVSKPLLENITAVRSQLRFLEHIIVAGDSTTSELQFDAWIAGEPDELEAAPTSTEDPCFWLYSSGTTGFPKGAVHLQHDLLVTAETYASHVLQFGPSDRAYSVAKLFFAYGLGNAMTFPFSVGAAAILDPGRPEPQRVFANIQRYRPTVFYSVPTSYAALLAYAEHHQIADLGDVRLCVSAGEALPAAIYERWRARFGVEILDGIGSTEMLHIFISNRPGQARPGSSGQLVPGYEARIVDENGRDLPPGEIGTLLINGDSAAAYYWNKHEKSKQTFLGPWTNTGDKYRQDEQGFFWYAGRSDDMLKVGGIWVSPVEIEATLIEHEAVQECAVIGATNADGLTEPHAFVVIREGIIVTDQLALQLQEFVKGRIAPYKYPRRVTFVSDLPKTATGKIRRFKLREQLDAQAQG